MIKSTLQAILIGVFVFGSQEISNANDLYWYGQRPKILDIEEAPDPKREKILNAYLDFLIQLYALYPDQQRVHLARDGETIFDLDMLIWNLIGQKGPKPTLINVSRKSAVTENLGSYLSSRGLSSDDIRKSMPPVVIDTGYEGSIIDAINAFLRPDGKQVVSHLISSAHKDIPSSRVATSRYFKGKLNASNKEIYLDAVGDVVETIENFPHFTTTSTDFQQGAEGWDAVSLKPVDEQEREKALQLMRAVKSFAAKNSTLSRFLESTQVLSQIMSQLQVNSLKPLAPKQVQEQMAQVKDLGLELFWPDLRESVAKGTVILSVDRLTELWSILGGLPELPDLEPPQFQNVLLKEQRIYTSQILPRGKVRAERARNQTAPPKAISPKAIPPKPAVEVPLVSEILKFHKAAKSEAEKSYYKTAFGVIEEKVAQQRIKIDGLKDGRSDFRIGKKIGEGTRGDVYEMDVYVLKVAARYKDMRYLEVEKMVAEYLVAHEAKYGIKVLPIEAFGERGAYIVRRKLDSATIGDQFLSNGSRKLNKDQESKLEELFDKSRRFAAETGVGLDIKPDNLAWIEGDWVLFDVGPRTSYGPYAMTLDIPNFQAFKTMWLDDSPKKGGMAIQTVIDAILTNGCDKLLR